MFTRDGLLALHGWTHERIDMLVDHAEAKLSPSQFVTELPGFGFASVRDQLVHLIGAEERWMLRLQDRPLPRRSAADYPTVESVRALKKPIKAATVAYIQGLPEAALNTELVKTPQGWIGTLRSPAFIMHHVVTHAFHHKGQVVAMFRLLGHPAPDTDLQD
jgi:uncharacterized damage-inducible protein DinB